MIPKRRNRISLEDSRGVLRNFDRAQQNRFPVNLYG